MITAIDQLLTSPDYREGPSSCQSAGMQKDNRLQSGELFIRIFQSTSSDTTGSSSASDSHRKRMFGPISIPLYHLEEGL